MDLIDFTIFLKIGSKVFFRREKIYPPILSLKKASPDDKVPSIGQAYKFNSREQSKKILRRQT